jgi:uncharacterized membrane protein YjgN (DUF898 family)
MRPPLVIFCYLLFVFMVSGVMFQKFFLEDCLGLVLLMVLCYVIICGVRFRILSLSDVAWLSVETIGVGGVGLRL